MYSVAAWRRARSLRSMLEIRCLVRRRRDHEHGPRGGPLGPLGRVTPRELMAVADVVLAAALAVGLLNPANLLGVDARRCFSPSGSIKWMPQENSLTSGLSKSANAKSR